MEALFWVSIGGIVVSCIVFFGDFIWDAVKKTK